jgi:cytoskeletal protein RodZ
MENDRGSLKDTSIIKLVLSIFEQELTGILYLKYGDTLKTLYFNRGKLIWAVSNAEEDKLENILLTQGIVDPELLMKSIDEIDSPESLGKSMVEKGIITLEELIESSKIQLKKIIISILKWTEGGFHFVRDNPPDRLLSLELNITDFIIDFIVKEVEIDQIKMELGSLHLVLVINPDENKISKYNLSDKQKELLDNFKSDQNLEKILSKYSSGHQESLLKIVYFFLTAELLIKKGTELTDASLFDDGTTLDDFVGEKKEAEVVQETEKPKTPEVEEDISFVFRNAVDSDKTNEEVDLEDNIELPSSKEEVPPLFSQEVNTEKRKKIKFINIILLFFTLIIAGIILLYIAGVFSDDSKDTTTTTKDDNTVINVKEPKPKVEDKTTPPSDKIKEDKNLTPNPTQKTPSETGNKQPGEDSNKTDKSQAEKPEVIPLKKAKTQPKTEPEKTEKKPEKKTVITPGKSASDYFQEGDMTTAGEIWNRDLKKQKFKYSILLEMDCLKDSVIRAYEQINDKDKFFILNKKVGERGCFLVMWGFFTSWEAAEEGMRSVPQYFKKQQYPPRVVELSRYLQ